MPSKTDSESTDVIVEFCRVICRVLGYLWPFAIEWGSAQHVLQE